MLEYNLIVEKSFHKFKSVKERAEFKGKLDSIGIKCSQFQMMNVTDLKPNKET